MDAETVRALDALRLARQPVDASFSPDLVMFRGNARQIMLPGGGIADTLTRLQADTLTRLQTVTAANVELERFHRARAAS